MKQHINEQLNLSFLSYNYLSYCILCDKFEKKILEHKMLTFY